MPVFIEGRRSEDERLLIPLESAAIVFLLQYCHTKTYHLYIVELDKVKKSHIAISLLALRGLSYSFVDVSEVEEKVVSCSLPVVKDELDNMIRSGLCGTARHIIKVSHQARPDENFQDLLGFRAGSLKACAEVSGWTKLCEVELPVSIAGLMENIRSSCDGVAVNIPVDIMKLELHFEKPPPLHNDDKKKRTLVKQIQQTSLDAQLHYTEHIHTFFGFRDLEMTHGNMKYRVIQKGERNNEEFTCKFGCTPKRIIKWCSKCNDRQKLQKKQQEQVKIASRMNGGITESVDTRTDTQSTGISDMEELACYVESLTLHDIDFEHLYAEGISFTVADVILFVYIYFLLESADFQTESLLNRLPCIRKWVKHLVTLPRIEHTSFQCGFKMEEMIRGLEGNSCVIGGKEMQFSIPDLSLQNKEDEGEISRRNRSKQKALKPEIARILEKMKDHQLEPTVSQHPCGRNIEIDWESLPREASLKDELPEKRIPRKCQQLENLATAVRAISKPGDVIVDFCSGGGHLGIIIAYLLPECEVHLVENKEESLLRAKTRVEKLNLENVTLYQCNLDYYQGKFDIGVCLHACGVATDMVLQQCIDRKAGFVICPCCYGSIQNTHLITYPRSHLYREATLSDKEFIILGHAADQTDFNMELSIQGKHCMNLVDTDRSALAQEHGYTVTLCSLLPHTCTPKNNLLIGTLS